MRRLPALLILILLVSGCAEDIELPGIGFEDTGYREQAEGRIASLEKQVLSLEQQVQNLTARNSALLQRNEEIKLEYEEALHREVSASESKTEVEKKYTEINDRLEANIEEINRFQDELNEASEWFKANSAISTENSIQESVLTTYMNSKCFRDTGTQCKINLGCIYLVNDKLAYLRYKVDTVTSEAVDRLQTIPSFLKNKGGDCEDFALLYKAELNYLINQCSDYNPKTAYIESWVPAHSQSNTVLIDYNYEWQLAYAYNKVLNEGYIYPVVVCGRLYDLNTKTFNGHCLLAFGKKRIGSEEDIYGSLSEAPLIEPQNGGYVGEIGTNIALLSPAYSGMINRLSAYIFYIITDSELYLYDTEAEKWISYTYFSDVLEQRKSELERLVN